MENNFDTSSEISSTGGESAIDTQEEVDLISGGIGFDEDVGEETRRLELLNLLRNDRR